MKRVFLMVLDSVGIGELPDGALYGDEGSNTLAAAAKSPFFHMPNMEKLGLFSIDGVEMGQKEEFPQSSYGRLKEASKGKDTTTGHWEIAGLISQKAMPTFPSGFPEELIREFEKETKRGVLCNQPYSGTKVIEDYGPEHMRTGSLIVYTSADSVFQVAAHEEIVPVPELYRCCEIARKLCQGPYGVGRVIARPFIGKPGSFQRTSRRHDFSLEPPRETMLDWILKAGLEVRSVGKIVDIFAGKGIGQAVRTTCNQEGIEQTIQWMKEPFCGLCFTNLVDYDMLYGHRNDVDGYAKALSYFDSRLPELLAGLGEEDIFIITADHGCDPSTPSTDHSREYTPLIVYGRPVKKGVNLGTRDSFADIGATVLEYLQVEGRTEGVSFWKEIRED